MNIKLTKVADAQSKATIYTLTKTDDNKKSAVIKIVDVGNNGLDNTDTITAMGKTSLFTNEEIKTKLLNGYKNTSTASTLPDVEYTTTNDNLDITEGKENSLGSFAKLLGVDPAVTSTAASGVTKPANIDMPTMPCIDELNYGSMGVDPTGATALPTVDYAKYQKAMDTYSGIGALMGVLSSFGGDFDMGSSYLLPMLMQKMLPDIGNLFTAPTTPAASTPEKTATDKTDTTPTDTTPAKTTVKAKAPAVTDPAPVSSTIVEDARKEYQELQSVNNSNKQILTKADGTIIEKYTDEKTGDRIINHRASEGGKILDQARYYKGTNTRRVEWFDGDKKGKLTFAFTDKNGSRVISEFKTETGESPKLVRKSVYAPSATARNAKVDATAKELSTELVAAQKEFDNATGENRTVANDKVWEIKNQITALNSLKTSTELKTLDTELTAAKAEYKKAKTQAESNSAAAKISDIETKISFIETNTVAGEKINYAGSHYSTGNSFVGK